MTLEKAFFILRHGSAEGEHKYFEAISVIEKAYNRLKAENKNCGVKIQNQREQLKACNEKIRRLEVDNDRLKRLEFQADALNEAYDECVREALKKVAEQVNQIICENCYPDFNAKGKPVNVFNAVNGYKAIDNLFKKEMGCGE